MKISKYFCFCNEGPHIIGRNNVLENFSKPNQKGFYAEMLSYCGCFEYYSKRVNLICIWYMRMHWKSYRSSLFIVLISKFIPVFIIILREIWTKIYKCCSTWNTYLSIKSVSSNHFFCVQHKLLISNKSLYFIVPAFQDAFVPW